MTASAASEGQFLLPVFDAEGHTGSSEAAQALRATDDATVARLYRRAYWLRRHGDVRQGGHLLSLLLMMRPFQSAFWAALGECAHVLADHETAVLAMARAAQLQPDQSAYGRSLVRYLLAAGRSDLAAPLLPPLMALAARQGQVDLQQQLAAIQARLEMPHAA